jgi:AbrB family looped-hinge helix DNA binding protein
MATTVTSRGRITIPKLVRDRLGLAPGSRIEFELDADGRVLLTKTEATPSDRFAALRGIAFHGMTTDEAMALLRG